MAALGGALSFWVANTVGGTVGAIAVFVLAVIMAVLFYLASRRKPINGTNVNDEWIESAPVPQAAVAA